MSILIVEDNPVNAKFLETVLKKESFVPVITRSGEEALKALVPGGDVDLIITDYSMPEMTGLQFVSQLKGRPGLAEIPIVVMSSYPDQTLVAQARELACVDFLAKPIDTKVLLSKVRMLLKDQPSLITSKHQTMQKYGLKPEEYDEMLSAFSGQIEKALPILTEVKDSTEPVEEPILRLMKEVVESGRIIGAGKLVRIYDTVPQPFSGADCRALLSALQQVAEALSKRLRVSGAA